MKAVDFLRRFIPAHPDVIWAPAMKVASHVVAAGAREQFLAAGYRGRHFFPHRVHYLPKCGPDGARLAEWMCGVRDPDQLWQVVLYGLPPSTDEFPEDLFFDREILWHEQHFNLAGQVASASLAMRGDTLYTMAHQSDLVQRISRRRQFKTRIERVFEGWHHMLLHAILAFAAERGMRRVCVPTSRLAMEHTDRQRHVLPDLFERVYDRAVQRHAVATQDGGWWSIPVEPNKASIIPFARCEEELTSGKTLCVCHDIERGLGHVHVDAEFARTADAESPKALERMLQIEHRMGVRATYGVVGCMMSEVRQRIDQDGHCVAFHSYDHEIGRDQLERCRNVDYRIKGYRPPQSLLTKETRGPQLCWHNFEWIASSASSLRSQVPRLEHRLAKVPILFDDFPLHTGQMTYDDWRRMAMTTVHDNAFVAFSLHDCYAPYWLPHYESFLEEVALGVSLRTMDQVAAELFLSSGV